MDEQKRVMGNMVAAGRFLKYSPWENYGTTLGLKRGNQLEMVTARTEGSPGGAALVLVDGGSAIVEAKGQNIDSSPAGRIQ
ncbi:hypothetical protein Q2T42_30975 [Leptolyngbya boryana CZ1]|uniref:Uncharacterized protein n=1 Tax=Leptolyngbya boryana CZ1 TaxID=3060204 RepID=A0AA96WXY8_LEPBY|nr:hypothetical protein [Leptolyngbya boryana]WNZ46214.1 hypothetical protein Q2T42_30975 [Leptolyngbya boryana CZ1]